MYTKTLQGFFQKNICVNRKGDLYEKNISSITKKTSSE